MEGTEVDTYLRQTSTPAEMEATLRALQRDAESARKVLRRPRRARRRASGTPSLWDAWPVDSRPNDCWRCDAASSVDVLGLCHSCRVDLSH